MNKCLRSLVHHSYFTHPLFPVIIDPPSVDYSTYEEALKLRKECQRIGADPRTGVVKDVGERCSIYRQRIKERLEILKSSAEAKIRNELRTLTHIEEKRSVENLSVQMMEKQLSDACDANDYMKVVNYARKGRELNVESVRGVTPLMCAIINSAPLDLVEELLTRGARANYVNKRGVTPLVLACLLREAKLVPKLVAHGADIELKVVLGAEGGNTVLHVCAQHGCEEVIK